MKKRLTAVFLCLSLILTLLPATAFAADTTDTGTSSPTITVGDAELTGNAGNPAYAITTSEGVVTTKGATAANYNVKWDGETLILRNAVIIAANNQDVSIICETPFTLLLEGKNTIDNDNIAPSIVVFSDGTINAPAALTISGEGSSTVTLEIDEAVTLSAVPSEFKFIVAPGTYSNGFRITVTDNADKTTEIATAAAEVTLTAGTIKNFGGTMGVYASDFEHIYIIGDGTFYTPWSLDEMIGNPAFNSEKPEESEWSSAFTHAGNGIYTWTGVLAPGTFKFPWKNSFNDFFGYQDGRLVYHPDGAAPDDPKYTVGTAGNYTITIDIHKLTFDIKTNSTYSVPEELYLIGDVTPGGWDLSKAIKMENQGNGIFYVKAELSDSGNAEGFKFVFNQNTWDGIQFAWALNRIWQGGTDRKNDMVGNEGYGDGLYSIRVDTVNWTYELKKIS